MRRLCWVLALVLVPVLIIAGPAAPGAQAATKYGDPIDTNYTLVTASNLFPATTCTTRSQWVFDGFMMKVLAKTKCVVPWIGSMGTANGGTLYDVQLTYNGSDALTGEDCSLQTPRTDETPIKDGFTLTATGLTASCDVDEVCFSFNEDRGFWEDSEYSGCGTANVGHPEVKAPPVTKCAYGTVSQPTVLPWEIDNAGGWYYWKRHAQATIDATNAAGPATWSMYIVTKRWDASAGENQRRYTGVPVISYVTVSKKATQSISAATATVQPGTLVTLDATSSDSGGAQFENPPNSQLTNRNNTQLIGVGIYKDGGSFGEVDGLARIGPNGRFGVSNANDCAFYWGTKIFEDSTDRDEPVGPVPDGASGVPAGSDTPAADPAPPEAEESECSFSFSDPSTWLEGGMCAAVGLLGKLLSALGKILSAIIAIPAAIVGALADILKGLFVPSAGFFTGEVDDVKNAWSQTPPVEVVSTFTGVGDAVGSTSSDGCSGPKLDVTMPSFGGASDNLSLHPFSSCADWSSTFARVTRTVITLGTYLGALLLAIRILAASVGLQFSFGNGDD